MKVFISWSGERSREMAKALREWLPLVLHYLEPWLSEADISAGERWSSEVARQLEASSFGIICLTRENMLAPWILFEAGALAKFIESSAVCPYLLDLEFQDLAGPLSQFQAKKATRDSTLGLLEGLNQKSEQAIDGARLSELFDALWPSLKKKLQGIPTLATEDEPARDPEAILEKLFSAVMSIESRLKRIESATPQGGRNVEAPKPGAVNAEVESGNATRIYVGNLPFSATIVELEDLFGAFGEVESIHLVQDRDTGRPRGFGFVTMKSGASKAIEALHQTTLGGRSLVVNQVKPRSSVPNRW